MGLDAPGGILFLAFALGFLHALDADHIMAVSGLACTRPGRRSSLSFCLWWALGHGLMLLAIGSAVLLLGVSLPEQLGRIAEALVGVVLLAIGGWVLWDVLRQRVHLHYHQHDGLPRHAHWHRHPGHTPHHIDAHDHQHGAVMVGMLHGTAGSAPLLGLLPLGAADAPWLGLGYLLLFSLAVLLAMLLCGGLLAALFHRVSRHGAPWIAAIRTVIALCSIAYGAWWLSLA